MPRTPVSTHTAERGDTDRMGMGLGAPQPTCARFPPDTLFSRIPVGGSGTRAGISRRLSLRDVDDILYAWGVCECGRIGRYSFTFLVVDNGVKLSSRQQHSTRTGQHFLEAPAHTLTVAHSTKSKSRSRGTSPRTQKTTRERISRDCGGKRSAGGRTAARAPCASTRRRLRCGQAQNRSSASVQMSADSSGRKYGASSPIGLLPEMTRCVAGAVRTRSNQAASSSYDANRFRSMSCSW